MGRDCKQRCVLPVFRLLDNYPGLFGASEDTLGLLNGTLSVAVDVIHAIEGDIKTMNLGGPVKYLYQTESLGDNAQNLCLDMLGELTHLVSGCDVSNITSHILPGCDEEKLLFTFEVNDLANHSHTFKNEVEDLVTDYTKVYRYEKHNAFVECSGEHHAELKHGIYI